MVLAMASESRHLSVSRHLSASPNLSVSRHLSVCIDRPAAAVYAYVSNPANLIEWAPGLGSAVARRDGDWYVETPDGQVKIEFVPPNPHGVLDHDLTMPSGEVVYNPMRVIADGDGCEVVFTLRRRPGMTDEEWAHDADLVAGDLARLARAVET